MSDIYSPVILDLKQRKRDNQRREERLTEELEAAKREGEELERTLQNLIRLAEAGGGAVEISELIPESPTPGPYSGMTIVEAATTYLEEVGEPARGTRQILDALLEGGLETDAKNPYNTIFATLKRDSSRDGTEIAKVGSKWGLKAWLTTVPGTFYGGYPEVEEDKDPK